jgi:hypothetical protein
MFGDMAENKRRAFKIRISILREKYIKLTIDLLLIFSLLCTTDRQAKLLILSSCIISGK